MNREILSHWINCPSQILASLRSQPIRCWTERFGRPKQLPDNSKQDDPPVIEQRIGWHSMSDAELEAIEAFAVAAKARQIATEARENQSAAQTCLPAPTE